MAGNAAQEARRTLLKPKSRRQNTAGSRGQSPSSSFPGVGDSAPLFQQPSFAPPAAQSFSFEGAFKPPGVNNPFAGFSQIGQDPNLALQHQRDESVDEQDLSRKKPFQGFSSTMNTQNTSNMFSGQGATPGSPKPFTFGTSNAGSDFGNNQAQSQPPTSSFTFGSSSTQAQAPSSSGTVFGNIAALSQPSSSSNLFGSIAAPTKPTTNTFSFGQSQTQASDNKSPVFGNGGGFLFNSNTSTNPISSSSANIGSVLAQSQPPNSPFTFGQTQTQTPSQTQAKSGSFTFGQTQTPVATQTPAKSESFTFGSTPQNPTTSQTPAKPSLFSFNKNSQAQPQSSSGPMFSTTPAPATPRTSLFNSNPTSNAGSTPFSFGGEKSSDMFNISSSKPPSPSITSNSLLAGTSQPTSSSPVVSSAHTANLFSGFTSGSPKPVSNSGSSANGDYKDQTPKPFSFGAPAKPEDNNGSEKHSSESIFGNTTEKPAANVFGVSSASQSQSTPSSTNVFQFGKSSESATGSNIGTPPQQPNVTNGFTPLFNVAPSNAESKKDESGKIPSMFGQSQPSQKSLESPQASLPSSSNLFGTKPAQNQKESDPDPTASSSGNNGTSTAKDLGSSLSKPSTLFGSALDSSKAATNLFAQKHKPTRPSPLSQSMTGSPSSDTEKSTTSTIFQDISQANANPTDGLSSIVGSPSKSAQEAAEKEDAEYKKEYNAAKRLRSLNLAVKNALNRMPITADVSKFLVFYETRRQEILKDVVKTKRKAVDDGDDEDGSGPSPLKRQRQNNGRAAPTSPPKFVSSGESFKENEVVQPEQDTSSWEKFCSTPTKPPAKQREKLSETPARPVFNFSSKEQSTIQQDKLPETPARPVFNFSSKEQSTIYGSTTPRGSPPKNLFAAQALKTPAPLVPKEPPQTEKPKSTTSILSAGTSTVPRKNPPSKFNFADSSQPSLFAAPKTNGTVRGSSPPKQAAPSSNSQQSQTSLFASLNQPSVKQTANEPPQTNGFGFSVSKESTIQPPNMSQPKSNMFSSFSRGPSSTSTSSSTQSLLSSSTPSGLISAATSSPAPNGKRKADSQLTKDDFEAGENAVSTPNGKRQAVSQLTKDDFEASEKAPSVSSGKRKAEVQLTKDDYESSNGITGDGNKKVNGTRSETSMIFKNILDSPSQGSNAGHNPGPSSPQKKMFTLNKSDANTPRPNPFASLAVAQSLTPGSNQITKASAAPISFFGSSAVKNNDAPKSLFGASNSSSTPASIFSASNLGQKGSSSTAATQPPSTNGFSFGSIPKPIASTSTPPSFDTVPKTPVFAAAASSVGSSGLSVPEQLREKTEAKALKDALENEYDSEDDGDKSEWIKKWKEERAAKYTSKLKVPTFGVQASESNVSAAELIRQKTEKEALEKALVEYDSEDDGDKAEWIKKWKAERASKAKELSQQNKPVFVPGKGFSFSSQNSTENSPEPTDASKSLSKSIFGQPPASSTDVSRTSSPGPTTSANGSVLNGQMPSKAFSASNNIFAHLSDSGTDLGKDAEADDEGTDEGSEADDDEKRDPTYDPTTEPESQSPDSPVEETGPGIASAKKQSSAAPSSQAPSSGASTPKGSLFDRISKDSDGNPIREFPIENKENTQPSSPFNFFNNAAVDKTWNQNSPIKFGGLATTAPSVNITAATPPQKTFDFSTSVKPPATVSGSTTSATPFSNLFGSKAPATTQSKPSGSLFGSTQASSSGSETQTPAVVSGSSIFSNLNKPNTKPAISSSSLFGSIKTPETTTLGSSLFGSIKSPPVSSSNETATPAINSGLFSGLKAQPAAVGFSFGSSSSPAPSLLGSAVASAANSRATSPGATSTDNESNAPTETSNDPDGEQHEHHEQINLTNSRAGEEDEEVLLERRAKAHTYNKKEDKWIVKGTGIFRILKHKETGATRTLLRADPSGNVVLNKGLLGNFNYEANGKSVKLLTAGGDAKGLETWLVQVKTVELAVELAGVLESSKPKSS